MKVSVRNGRAHISGYVNAVERYSKPITEEVDGIIRTFLERIRAGAFRKALNRVDSVDILLNHNEEHVIARSSDTSVTLIEDNIGLRAELDTDDGEIVAKAQEGKLRGWSFGFIPNKWAWSSEGQYQARTVTDLDLFEVSILTDSKHPAYAGTSIETRTEKGVRKMSIRAENLESSTEELLTAVSALTEAVSSLSEKLTPEVIAALTKTDDRADDEDETEDKSAETETEDTTEDGGSESDDESTEDETEEESEDETDDESEDNETDETDGTDEDNDEDKSKDDEEHRSLDYSYFEERLAKF